MIVVACLAVTADTALLRPAPPSLGGPQRPILTPPRLPLEIPEVSLPTGAVIVQASGSSSFSVDVGRVVPVHGLPGQVGASP